METGSFTAYAGDNGGTTGDFNVTSGALLRLGGTFTLAGSADIAGTGAVEFSFGYVNGFGVPGVAIINGSFAIPTVTINTFAGALFDSGSATFNIAPVGLQSLTIRSGSATFSPRPSR